ncbi:hypothetical protein FC700_25145 [Bacillus mycoides]|nr:hypothetical protein FC700_25145 [Bacillus mycoides]
MKLFVLDLALSNKMNHLLFDYLFYDTSNQTKGGKYKMIKTVLTEHSFKYRRLLGYRITFISR